MIESQTIINELGALSYIGIWFVALCSNVIIPVPEEIVLLALGYLAGTGQVDILILLPLVMSGLFLSDLIMYRLSKRGSPVVTWLYEKFFAKRFRNKSDEWFELHMGKIIFFSRFLIQLRFIGPFMAGQKKVPQKKFVEYDLLALLIYVPLYVFLGLFFHSRVKSIFENVNVVKNIVLLIVGLILAFGIFKGIYKFLFGESPEQKKL